MKKDTKIFITCFGVGLWALNMGTVSFSRSIPLSTNSIIGAGGMAIGILFLVYGLRQHKEDHED